MGAKSFGSMNTRGDKKKQSRERILQAAYEEFSNHGIVETSTLQIARAAKVSHGGIFVHFPDRDALVIAVIENFGQRLAEALYHVAEKCSGIEELLKMHIVVLREFELFYAYLVTQAPLLSLPVRNAVFYIQSGIGTFLNKMLNHEIAKGRAKNIPLPMLLNTWLGLIHFYLANREKYTTGNSVLSEQGDKLVEFMMNYLILK